MNVLPLRTLIISLLLVTSLSGCGSLNLFGKKEKPLEVVTKPLDKTPLDLAMPDPIKAHPITWVLITPDNAEEIFKQMESRGQNLILFALTDDGYQQLSVTMTDIRNLINSQRTIILKYKDYYEPKKASPNNK